jgi:hypothetical protein
LALGKHCFATPGLEDGSERPIRWPYGREREILEHPTRLDRLGPVPSREMVVCERIAHEVENDRDIAEPM